MSVCVARPMAWSKAPICGASASRALLQAYIQYSPRQQDSTNHPHLDLPLHAIVRLHAAALSYPAESADASPEYTIGLCAAQAQLTVLTYLMVRSLLSRLGD